MSTHITNGINPNFGSYYSTPLVSADPVYAEVKELLRSYIESNMIDDLLFPRWTAFCMSQLQKGILPIKQTLLKVRGYEVCLPDDFDSVREAHTTTTQYQSYQSPSAYYYPEDHILVPANSVDGCSVLCDPCDDCCNSVQVTHKVTGQLILTHHFSIRLQELTNRNHPAAYQVRDGKMVVNFENGDLYLLYYAKPDDATMIPDMPEFRDYLMKYLMYMCYSQLYHSVTDESFNQIERKMQLYDQKQAEAYIVLESELKRETTAQIFNSIKRTKNRYSSLKRRML